MASCSWRTFADRMLNCHRSVGKLLGVCSKNPSTFLHSPGGTGRHSHFPSSSIQTRRHFSAVESAAKVKEQSVAGRQGMHLTDPLPSLLLSSSPCFMVPPTLVAQIENDESALHQQQAFHHFFNLKKNKVMRIKKKVTLSWEKELYSPDDSLCVGSSHGWLAMMDRRNCSLYLFNPFINFTPSCAFLPLPSIETLPYVVGVRSYQSNSSLTADFLCYDNYHKSPNDLEFFYSPNDLSEYFIKRFVFSSPPSSENPNCVVMARLVKGAGKLVYCKPGGTTWSILDGNIGSSDLIYFDEHKLFYVLDFATESIETWDFSDPSSPKANVINLTLAPRKLNRIEEKLRKVYCDDKQKYLVKGSSGEIFLVLRFIAKNVAEDGTPLCQCVAHYPLEEEDLDNDKEDSYSYGTLRFDVYKLDFGQNKWDFANCLGDRALFVGRNHSFSLSASEFPEVKGNCIYFTDDWAERTFHEYSFGGHDMGVYNYEDDHITPFFPSPVRKIQPAPIWLAPSSL